MSQIPRNISTSKKPEQLRLLINEALYILAQFGVPLERLSPRRLKRMAMAFLAVANVRQSSDWKKIDSSHRLRTRDIAGCYN